MRSRVLSVVAFAIVVLVGVAVVMAAGGTSSPSATTPAGEPEGQVLHVAPTGRRAARPPRRIPWLR